MLILPPVQRADAQNAWALRRRWEDAVALTVKVPMALALSMSKVRRHGAAHPRGMVIHFPLLLVHSLHEWSWRQAHVELRQVNFEIKNSGSVPLCGVVFKRHSSVWGREIEQRRGGMTYNGSGKPTAKIVTPKKYSGIDNEQRGRKSMGK
ncbi:hypothetical protein niasHS_015339 [Heterodera schachtii]|uniref:Gland protein n=1 Tax=Heterodera schachtii TaxID=97005 RepID=A0ABD2I1W3_HETSC